MPINEVQESDIRDFLSIVGLFFQFENSGKVGEHREKAKKAYSDLVMIMNAVNPLKEQVVVEKRISFFVPKEKYVSLCNIILDKLQYDENGRDKFIQSCIDKL